MEKMAKNAEKCYFGKCKDSLERVICNSKQYYAMFKIKKCENCVIYLQFALIATGRLKPDKALKVIFGG